VNVTRTLTQHTVFLETFGCQMNVLDSELVMGELRRAGYTPVDDPTLADLVLINTCSVRQRAEEKVYSRLGELRRIKLRRPAMIVAVLGCMAEREGEAIYSRAPHVDVVCGPGELGKLTGLIERVQAGTGPVVSVTRDWSRRRPASDRHADDELEALDRSRHPAGGRRAAQAYIRVQRGCDKFCSYCVVPFVRGPERSRPPSHIVEEARTLVEAGAIEITLLGQSINSYAYQENGRIVRLPELLERVHEIDGLRRLRFITSFPGDFDEAIFRAMRDLPKVCEYLHLPAQSGSDRILAAMRRDHTVEHYEALVGRARELVPNLSLAGDFIVGFPGETEEDFRASCDLVRRMRYKNIFVFKYSTRPATVAARNLIDDVPRQVKRRRNMELLAIQAEIASAHNQSMIGRQVEVLVEGYSKRGKRGRERFPGRLPPLSGVLPENAPVPFFLPQLTGRTRGDQIVVFNGDESLIGRIVQVEITSATDLTMHGHITAAV
jgi:tRNA-2-methylthio-N6-dimethylallyladenosine synthase